MIDTAEQLYQAIEQMGRMQRILESYRNEILMQNPRNFALLAKGPLEQLRQLQMQIDEYLQRVEATPISANPDWAMRRERKEASGGQARTFRNGRSCQTRPLLFHP
jgi:hypothetical protein